MNSLYTLSVLFLCLYAAYGLQCYDGFAILKGSTAGNDTKTCGKSTDMCYKANMDLKGLMHFKLAGCSTIKCMLHGNGCTNRTIAGITIEVCCCNTDFCNDFGEQQRPSSEQLKQILNFFTSEEKFEKEGSTDQEDKINKLEKIIDSKPLESDSLEPSKLDLEKAIENPRFKRGVSCDNWCRQFGGLCSWNCNHGAYSLYSNLEECCEKRFF